MAIYLAADQRRSALDPSPAHYDRDLLTSPSLGGSSRDVDSRDVRGGSAVLLDGLNHFKDLSVSFIQKKEKKENGTFRVNQ